MLIGLTGGIGSGKSTLSKAAADLGFFVIDADKVGHNILLSGNPAYNEVVEHFGGSILSSNGEIDRKKLGEIVFSNSDKLGLLNQITHKRIAQAIGSMIKDCNNKNIVLEAAVLFESGMDKICDFIIAVVAPADERAKRIVARDSLDENLALERMHSQNDDSYYTKRAHMIICNDGDISQLYNEGIRVFSEVANDKA
jgi:dephospho-CoA kinase